MVLVDLPDRGLEDLDEVANGILAFPLILLGVYCLEFLDPRRNRRNLPLASRVWIRMVFSGRQTGALGSLALSDNTGGSARDQLAKDLVALRVERFRSTFKCHVLVLRVPLSLVNLRGLPLVVAWTSVRRSKELRPAIAATIAVQAKWNSRKKAAAFGVLSPPKEKCVTP